MNKISDFENKIINSDCMDAMKTMPSDSVDLILFSPPYDNTRLYGGEWSIDLPKMGEEIHRILKDGGVCCMLIQDQTKDFCKSGITWITTAKWISDYNLKLFECCIYQREAIAGAFWKKRWKVNHEYLLQFFKGKKPKTFNKEHMMVDCKYAGKKNSWSKNCQIRQSDNEVRKEDTFVNPDKKCIGTVWNLSSEKSRENRNKGKKTNHPATMINKLANDIIKAFTLEGDIVLDPMAGSGTTCVEAKKLNRKYIGLEINKEYCDLANEILNDIK
jgi:site-specific DNA-methyltransferase (adenine-specific)